MPRPYQPVFFALCLAWGCGSGCTPIYTSAKSTVTLQREANLAELASIVSKVEAVQDITETPSSQGRFLLVFPVEYPAILSFRDGPPWGQLRVRADAPLVELRAGTVGTPPTEAQRQQSRELLDRVKDALGAAAL